MILKTPPPAICFTGNPVKVVLWHDYPYAIYSPRDTLDPLDDQGPNLSLEEFMEGPFSEYVLRAVCGEHVFDQGRPVLEDTFECEYDLQSFLKQAASAIDLPDLTAAHGDISLHSLPEYTLGAFVSFYRNNHSAIQYFETTYKALAGKLDQALHRKLEAAGTTWFEANPESFLTLQPNNTTLAQEQPHKLYFMISDDPPAQIRLLTRITPSAGLPYYIASDPITAQPGRLAEITINLSALEEVEKASFQLTDGTGQPISEQRSYIISKEPTLQLVFRNSLGVFDSFALFKPSLSSTEVENDYMGDNPAPTRSQGKQTTLAYPPPLTTSMRKYLEELRESSDIYKIESGQLIKIRIGEEAFEAFEGRDDVHEIELSIESDYNEKFVFKIFIDNQEIRLFKETTIPGQFNDPMFSQDGSFSFDVEIPSEGNRIIFEFPENSGSRIYRQRTYEARIEHFGRTIFCRCRLNNASDTAYKLNFYFEESAFYNRVKDLRIDQLNYNEEFTYTAPQIATAASQETGEVQEISIAGNDTPYAHQFANMEMVRNPLENFYLSGVNNVLGYKGTSPTGTYPFTVRFAIMINADYYPEGENHLVLQVRRFADAGFTNFLSTVFSRRINPNLNQVLFFDYTFTAEHHLRFRVHWNNSQTYGQVWYLGTHNITAFETWPGMTYPDPAEKKYSFFPTKYLHYTQDEYEGPVLNMNDLANYCYGRLSNNFIWMAGNTDYNFQEVFLGKLFPSFFARYIMNAIEAITGYEFVIPEEISDIENIVIGGQVNLVNPEYFLDPRKDLYYTRFTANEILPWESVGSFVKKLAKATGTFPVINDIENTFEFRPFTETILNREYTDITNKVISKEFEYPINPEGFRINYKGHPDPYFQEKHPTLEGKNILDSVELLSELPQSGNQLNDVRLVTSRDQYFQWTGTTWEVFADYPEMELFYNVSQENLIDYEIGLWPLISRTAFRPLLSTDSLLCPVTELPVHNIITDEPSNRQNLVLVYSVYRGMQYYMLNDVEYPLLSHNRQNVRGLTIAGTNFSASIIGADGIYMKRLKDYIFMLTADPIQCRAMINPTGELIFPKKKVMIDGVKYLVEQAEWAFRSDGLSEFDCLLRKVNN